MSDIYKDWLLAKAQANDAGKIEYRNGTPWGGWSGTTQLTPGQDVNVPSSYGKAYGDYAGYQLAQPEYGSSTSATPYGDYAGAGIAAAGQLAGSLANTAGGAAAMSAEAESSAESRASAEKMARMAAAQQAQQFQASRVQSVYDMLISALRGSANNTGAQRDLSRGISKNMMDGILTAYLG
jgi:hypothetical protein